MTKITFQILFTGGWVTFLIAATDKWYVGISTTIGLFIGQIIYDKFIKEN